MASEKVAMISQPMSGRTQEEIVAIRERAVAVLNEKGYVVVNTLFAESWDDRETMEKHGVKNIPVAFLGKAIEKMGQCDAVYFCRGWENARGCEIEHDVAQTYGLEILYE